MRSRLLVLFLALGLAGCPKSSPESDARLESSSGKVVVAYGGKTAFVPTTDLGHGGPRVPVTRDANGKRLAYPIATGGSRFVYVVGDGLFLGPTGSADVAAAPSLADALGAIFENAEGRRAQAVAEVKKEKGEGGVARMLGSAAHVDDPAWDDAFAALSDSAKTELKKRLAVSLEPGSPPGGLPRAVRFAALDDKSRAPSFAARVRELADPMREPRANAVLLRALAKIDPERAVGVGCDVLHKKPADDVLVEAAAIAVARGGGDCDVMEAALGDDACAPWFRCANGKPLDGRETTRQDEPLCTKDELAAAIDRELERRPEDVMAGSSGTRTGLFAFAALVAKDRVPATFLAAHARRRYAVAQPREPSCDTGMTPGSACHCEETVLRDWACRHRESQVASVGVCRFEIDDKAKRIQNVVATLPP